MKNKMEELLGLGRIQTSQKIPGIEHVDGREFLYIASETDKDFPIFFKKLIRHVSPPIPSNGGAVIEGCRITLPNKIVFHAISYKGDIEGWRKQIQLGAQALNACVAQIVNSRLVLADGSAFALDACSYEFN